MIGQYRCSWWNRDFIGDRHSKTVPTLNEARQMASAISSRMSTTVSIQQFVGVPFHVMQAQALLDEVDPEAGWGWVETVSNYNDLSGK